MGVWAGTADTGGGSAIQAVRPAGDGPPKAPRDNINQTPRAYGVTAICDGSLKSECVCSGNTKEADNQGVPHYPS